MEEVVGRIIIVLLIFCYVQSTESSLHCTKHTAHAVESARSHWHW